MKRTEHIIYDNYDIYSENCLKDAKEYILESLFGSSDTIETMDNFGKAVTVTKEEYAATVSEEQLYDVCSSIHSMMKCSVLPDKYKKELENYYLSEELEEV